MRDILGLLTVLCCCNLQLAAQRPVSRADSLERNTWLLYRKAAAPSLPLYNGAVYTATYPGIKGSPFLADTMWHSAQLQYEDVFYPEVQLSYDLVADELLLKGAEPIRLVPGKIGYFEMSCRRFVRVAAEERNGPAPGLYEILVRQPGLKLLAKRKKQAVRGFRAEDPFSFATYNDFYLQRNDRYYEISHERDLMQAAGPQKKAMKKFLRDQNLQYKRDPEATLRKAMQFFMQNTAR